MLSLKKKISLVIGMVLLCAILIYGVKEVQVSTYKSQTAKTENSKAEVKETASAEAGNSSSSVQGEIQQPASPAPSAASSSSPNSEQSKPAETKAANNSSGASSESKGNSSSTSNAASSPQNSNPATTAPATENKPSTPTPQTSVNFTVLDGDGNKMYEDYIPLDGKTLLYDLVDASLRRAVGKGAIKDYTIQSSGYVSKIGNLKEKVPSGSSGWLYYVNGNKPDFGIKDARAVFPADAKVVFRFYRDALNEK